MDAVEYKVREEFYRKAEDHNVRVAITRDKWSHWIAVCFYGLFFVAMNLKILELEYYPEYLSQYNEKINDGLHFATGALVIWLILRFASFSGVSTSQRVWDLPSGYLFLCTLLVGAGLIVFIPGTFTLGIGGTVLLLLASLYLVQHVSMESDKKRLALAIKKAREAATSKLVQAMPKIKVCEVCHEESLYDVCLDCEQKYKQERQRIRAQNWRAKQHGVEASLTLAQWLETLDAFHWHCAYCQDGPYEVMEHYVPITRGGGTEQTNCLPACFSCNSKKADKHPELEAPSLRLALMGTNKNKQTQKYRQK